MALRIKKSPMLIRCCMVRCSLHATENVFRCQLFELFLDGFVDVKVTVYIGAVHIFTNCLKQPKD